MLVQNIYQPHTFFLDIKTRVQSVYRPQIAFSDVKTRVQKLLHSFSRCQNNRLAS